MKRGDLVKYEGSFWLVQSYDARRTRLAVLLRADGQTQEVPHDLAASDGLAIIGNPSTEWPFVTVPEKPRWGRVTSISVVSRTAGLTPLTPFADYLFADPLRSGGSLFLRPGLKFRTGDILQAAFEKPGYVANVAITANFGTVTSRQARAAAKKPAGLRTVFDRLTSDNEDFEG